MCNFQCLDWENNLSTQQLRDDVDQLINLYQQILSALAVLLAMVAAVPMGEKGEVGSLLTEEVHDMDLAENKAKHYAKKAAKAQKKAAKAQYKAAKKAHKG